MPDTDRRSRTATVLFCAVLVVGLAGLVAFAGVTAAHGTYSAFLLTESPAVEDSPERGLVNLSTGGADEAPAEFRSERVRVEYVVFADGNRIDGGTLELDFLDSRTVEVRHSFSNPGYHELAVNATFSLGGGEWQRHDRSTRVIEVVSPGTEAAARACARTSGGGSFDLGAADCYLTHRGAIGLVGWLLASPVVLVGVVVAVVAVVTGIALVAAAYRGYELP